LMPRAAVTNRNLSAQISLHKALATRHGGAD
jgi:hypothetical protein